jgi:hypothetical protein
MDTSFTDLKDEISDIQIVPVPPKDGLVGFSSFIINKKYYVGSVAIFTSPSTPGGFRLCYPTKMGTYCFKPLSRQVGEAIQNAVIGRYLELMKKLIQEEDLNEKRYFED